MGNVTEQAELLRKMASFYLRHDSIQELIENEAYKLPQSDDRDETITFIRIMRMTTQAQTSSYDERRERLQEVLDNFYNAPAKTQMGRIEQLFNICVFLGHDTKGEMLNHFLHTLQTEISELPEGMTALRNLYYTRCAQTYTDGFMYDRAVEADKNLLLTIDRLIEGYRAEGREFINYDTNRYSCYRRMLLNYPALSEREIKAYYNRILHLANNDPDVAADLEANNLAHIYYFYATGQYDRALPLIKPYLTDDPPVMTLHPTRMYRYAREAAKALGDKQTYDTATELYNQQLEKNIESLTNDNYLDMHLLYEVSRLRQQKSELDITAQQARILTHRKVIMIVLIATLLMLALALFIFLQYRRQRQLSANLSTSNNDLRRERDELKTIRANLTEARDAAKNANRTKTDFITNIIHEIREPLNAISGFSQMIVDSVDDDKRRYLDRYSDIVTLNIDLVQSLVNDALSMAEIEGGHATLNCRTVRLQEICHLATESIALRIQPGVTMQFDETSPDINVYTDRRRVEQVLINLLQNAAKFTTEGTVTLAYTVDDDTQRVVFSVTDTGPGIPAGKAEQIFERYEKLDSSSQGTGLGLHICRLVARLLKGKVWVDESYTDGARFLFSIPIKINVNDKTKNSQS